MPLSSIETFDGGMGLNIHRILRTKCFSSYFYQVMVQKILTGSGRDVQDTGVAVLLSMNKKLENTNIEGLFFFAFVLSYTTVRLFY
jgi:hypothetical protein